MSIKITPVKPFIQSAKKQTPKITTCKSGLPFEAPLPDYREKRALEMLNPYAPMQNALNKIEATTQYIKNTAKK